MHSSTKAHTSKKKYQAPTSMKKYQAPHSDFDADTEVDDDMMEQLEKKKQRERLHCKSFFF